MPITTNLPDAVEQTLQRMKADSSYLQNYLTRTFRATGWEIREQSVPPGFIATYRSKGNYSFLVVAVKPTTVEIETQAVKKVDGDPRSVYKIMRTCGDLTSAQEFIDSERTRLETLVNEEYVAPVYAERRVA